MSKAASPAVIVTNARNRIAYNVVRSLGRRGVSVYAADSIAGAMSFASRYTSGRILYPSPFREPDAFVDCLAAEAVRLGRPVLIPVFEETFLVAKHRERLTQVADLVVPSYSQVLIAHNKDRWEHLAKTLGILVPRSYRPDELRAGGGLRDVRFPVLVKPKQGGGAWGITEVPSAAALVQILDRPDWAGHPWDRFFIQEKIIGHTHCVAMLFNQGRLRGKVAYRQLRDYPTTGGQATLRVSDRHDRAEADFERFLAHLGWHGPCQADFIVDGQTGAPYLIDVNPRLWGSLVQAIASGVDFPYLLYQIARQGDVEPVVSFASGVVTRWLGGEIAGLPSRLRASHSKLRLLREFLVPPTPAAMYDDVSSRDVLPFVTWSFHAVKRALASQSVRVAGEDSLEGVWE